MAHGHFAWTDLSTFDMKAARADYTALFGWAFHGDPTYDFATQNGTEVAAVFPMPPRLAAINMPSFWMSYVHVPDVSATLAKARTHDGVIIEVEPQSFGDNAQIALVRDPSGAGFTLYEGPDIRDVGTVAHRYHHLPAVALIETFYADLFGWTFEPAANTPWPTFAIRHPDSTTIAHAEEVPETILGTLRYWMPAFAVGSLQATAERIAARGGQTVVELPGDRLMLVDRQGAHFMVCASSPAAAHR